MNRHAGREKSVGLIGLEIINRNPFPNPFQGKNPLFRQPLPVIGQNDVARLEGLDRLEGPPAHIEGVLRGNPQGNPVGLHPDILFYFKAKDRSDVGSYQVSVRLEGPEAITGFYGADQHFRAVRPQDGAFRQEAALIMQEQVAGNKGPPGADQEVVRRLSRAQAVQRPDRNGHRVPIPDLEHRASLTQAAGLTVYPLGHLNRMLGGDPQADVPGGYLQVLLRPHPGYRLNGSLLESPGGQAPDRGPDRHPFDGDQSLRGPNRGPLFKTAAPAPGP